TLSSTVEQAIGYYLEPEKGIVLQHKTLNCTVTLFNEASLQAEPRSDQPLVIDALNNDTYGAVLPRRATCFRVWSKMDQSKEWLSSMPPLQSGKLFKGAGRLTQKYLSFDFEKLTEHAGNIYLCGCNPYLRGWNKKLLDIDTDLLVSFMERSGRTVEGMKLVLEDF